MADYDADVVLWSEQQANVLRRLAAGEKVNDQVDWSNIIDEVETVGRSERAALRSHIGTVLEHLMKLQASPATEPRDGWTDTVVRARISIARLLRDSPSMRRLVGAMTSDELPDARLLVARSLATYGEAPTVPLDSLTYSEEQVLGPWLP